MRKTLNLYRKQYDFIIDESPYTGFIAGIGSGKTYAGAIKSSYHAKGNTFGMVVAPTYGMLRDSTLRTFMELMDDVIVKFNKNEMLITLRNGAEIMFRSADNPEHLRGSNLNWAWIDEGGLCKDGTWEIVIGRLRADGLQGKLFVTTTPKGKRNWVYKTIAQMKVYRATTLDNPFVSLDWKQSLLDNYTGKFLRQEVFGDFVEFEGLVYDLFDQSVHVLERPLNEFIEFGLAIDEGYTNPACILKIYSDRDGGYHVEDEYYKTGKLPSEIVKIAKDWAGYSKCDIIVDASASGLIAELKNEGLNAKKREGRVFDGIQTIQEYLKIQKNKKPRLTISPKCVNLISEFESYAWKEGKDEPIKEFDHALDPLRYFITYPKKKLIAKQKKYA